MFDFSDEFDEICGKDITLRITQKYNGDCEMLPFYYWDIYNGDIFIGKISLRIGHNFHSYYNGNIGYEIDAAYRGHGYAYLACCMILKAARAHNMDKIIISCDESNIASYKTIEKLGAKLIEICNVPKDYFAWHEGMEKQRIYELKI